METRYATNQVLMPAIKELIDNNQSVKITITGTSMLPLLRNEQDQVELSKTMSSVKKADIVLVLRDNGDYILHRVFNVDEVSKQFYMVGDAQRDLEGPLRFDQIIAVVISFYRGNKRIGVQNLFYKGFVWVWFKLIRFRHIILRILRKLRIIP